MTTHRHRNAARSGKTFEDRLLVELRQVVQQQAEHPTASPEPAPAASGRSRWMPRLAVAAGATAAGVAGAMVLPSMVTDSTAAAYAVTPQQDGTIEVEISQVSDAKGLERELEQADIPAKVDYLDSGMVCDRSRLDGSQAVEVTAARGGGGNDQGTGVRERRDGASLSFTLHPERFRDGQTLVITTSGSKELSSIRMAVVRGSVQPCEPIPAEQP